MVVSRYLTDMASASTASDIQLGSCVTEIGDGAFSGYTNITDVELPDALTKIGASAFKSSSIQNIDIPDGVTVLESETFRGCSSLTSCTIGSGVTAMTSNVFYGCGNLKRMNSDTDGVCNLPSSLEKIGGQNFFYCDSIKKINVLDNIKTIDSGAFRYCRNLEECTIGSGVTSIGSLIFTGCTNFNKVRVTAPTPPTISSDTFKKNGESASVYGNYQIYVPCGSYDAYTGATNWSNYKSRIVCDDMPYKAKFYYSDGSYAGIIPCDDTTRLTNTAVTNAWNDEYVKVEIGDCITEIYGGFDGKTGITEVVWDTTTASTITTIRGGFNNLSNATFPSTLPPNVQTITSGSFNNCHLNNVILNTGMTIGGGSYASDGAFNGSVISNLVYDVNTDAMGTFLNSTLSSLTIGNNVTTIPKYTFSGIKGLTALTIPSNVTSIDMYNFNSSDIEIATIPATSLGQGCFRYSYSLRKLNIDSGATFYNGGSQLCPFYGCSALTTVNSEEEGVVNLNNSYIGSYMFYRMPYTELNLGSNFTSAGSDAFSECGSLKKIHIIGNSSTQLGYNFRSNTQLEEVIIDNCSSYSNDAFNGCTKLKKMTIGSGVTATNFCLSGKTSLTDVEFKYGYGSQILAKTFSGCTSLSSVTIPSTVTSIGDYAFANCTKITDIDFIPNTVTSIGNNAFYRCTGMTNIDIPSNITTIGSNAFSECSGATTLIIPSSVLSIGNGAFLNDSKLSSVLVGRSTPPTIGTNVFGGSNCFIYVPLASYDLYINAQNWSSYADRIIGIGMDYKAMLMGGTSKVILCNNNNVLSKQEVGSNAATTINIGNCVTEIGESAFTSSSSMETIVIPSGVTSIGSNAFKGVSSLKTVNGGDKITAINDYAFYGCKNLKNYTIPSGVTSIGSNAFAECSALTSVSIPSGVTSIGSNAFSGSGVQDVVINSSAGVNGAFRYCRSLSSVTVSSGITSIGTYAFSGCTSLSVVELPNTLTTLECCSFIGCPIENVVIPSSVTYVGHAAFGSGYGTGAKAVTFRSSTPPTFADGGCGGMIWAQTPFSDNCIIYVPCGSYDAYSQALPKWRDKMVIYGDYEKDEEVVGEYICDNGNKYKKIAHYVSQDNQNWCLINYVKGQLIEASSEDCAFGYEVNLNSQWSASTSYGSLASESSNYDFYESYSNYHVDNGKAMMFININGYETFTFKVRNYSESSYDYVVVNKLDDTTSPSWQPSDSDIYYSNRGKSSATEWYDVTFSNLNGEEHTIAITYGKDSSSYSDDDKGYIAIPNS